MKKPKILIAEDNSSIGNLLRSQLEDHNYIVPAIVNSGIEAISRASDIHPDIVIMDVNLKGNMDGITAAQKILSNKNIPVIYLTAYADDDLLKRARTTSPYGYVLKPYKVEELYSTIEMALYKRKQEKKIEKVHHTNRKQTEEELRKSEERYRLLAENIPDVVIVYNFDLKPIYVSPSATRLSGYTVEELMNQKVEKLVTPASYNAVMKAVTKDLEIDSMVGKNVSRLPVLQVDVVCKDGSIVPVEAKMSLLRDIDKQPIGYLGVVRDITERKQAEEKMQLLSSVMEQVNDSIIIVNCDNEIIFANRTAEELWGYTQDEMIGKSTAIFNSEPLEEKMHNDIYETIYSGKTFYGSAPSKRKNGSTFICEFKICPICNEEGQISQYVGIQRDITDAKQAIQALEESEKKFRTFFEGLGIGAVMTSGPNQPFLVNQTFADFLGYTKEELESRPAREISKILSRPEDYASIVAKARKLDSGEIDVSRREKRYVHKSGEIVWGDITTNVFRDKDEKLLLAVATIQDITEQKEAERHLLLANEKLQQEITERSIAEENFRNTLDNSPLGIRIATEDGEPLYTNQAMLNIFGYTSNEQMKTIPLIKRHTPNSYAEYQKRAEDRKLGKPVPQEFDIGIIHHDGKERNLRVFRRQVIWNGEPQIMGLHQDITEQKQAKEALEQSYTRLKQTLDQTVDSLSVVTEMRDPYTAGHQHRVAQLAMAISNEMGLPQEKIEGIRVAGILHDVGKISVPAEILSKPSELTEIEFEMIKKHSDAGYNALKNITFPWPVAEIILQHHERLDGSGYPEAITEEGIFLEAKILAVADVVEAMSSHRPYRPAFGIKTALDEISQNKGTLFDPNVVNACVKLFTEKGFKLE
jgi:PAS domain S-box-containing protein/putative nucleotidyltransferase with HDIG domain